MDDDFGDQLLPDTTTTTAPEPIKIVVLDAAKVAAALDPERASNAEARMAATKDWLTVDAGKIKPAPTPPQPMGKSCVTMGWTHSSMLKPVTLEFVTSATTPPLPWYTKAVLGPDDMLRIFSAPLSFAGQLAVNAPIMGADAVVIFPGQDVNSAITNDDDLPLDPPPNDEFSTKFDAEALERAAVVLGVHLDGTRRGYQCKVRRVRRSAKLVVEHTESTIALLSKPSPEVSQTVGAEQITKAIWQLKRRLELLDALIKHEGNGDPNMLQFVLYEYSVANWPPKTVTPYVPYVTKTSAALLQAAAASEDKFTLLATVECKSKTAGTTVKFAIKFTVPLAQPKYFHLIKARATEYGGATAPAAASTTAATKAPTTPKPAPEPKDLAQATPANTERAVALAAGGKNDTATVVATAAANLAATKEEMVKTHVTGGPPGAADDTGKAAKTKPAREEAAAGAPKVPKTTKKTTAAKANGEVADPDADVDDKVPAAAAAAAATTATTGAKRKQTSTEEDAPAAKRTATEANGASEASRKTKDSDAFVHAQPVAVGSAEWHTKCANVTKKLVAIDGKLKSETSDEKLYGVIRGFEPVGVTGEALQAANRVQNANLGAFWQTCNYLGITPQVIGLLTDKHLKPVAPAKPVDEGDYFDV